MFGLLNPGRQDLTFRRAYSRCCQHQRRRYGLPSLSFLSYESVLLYLCAADMGKVALDDLPQQTCCKLRRIRGPVPDAEREVARFCTSVGLLLAYIKVSDDLRDRPTLPMRLANWLLKNRFREAFDYFKRLDPTFEQRVAAFVADHLKLERPGVTVPVQEYARGTARAFGYVFSLFGRLSGMEAHAGFLTELGTCVGNAIIGFDCAIDWHKDQRRGAFNPLPDGEESVEASLAFCRRQLTEAAELCRRHFGTASHTGRVMEQVAGRIPRACRVPACQRFQGETTGRLRRWGVGRKKGFQLNEGLDLWLGIAGFCAVGIGAVACLFTSGQKQKAEEAARAARAKAADLPPDGTPPTEQAAAAQQTGQKKHNDCLGNCGDCFCCCSEAPDCSGCEGCFEACNGCDGCSGCDCNCG